MALDALLSGGLFTWCVAERNILRVIVSRTTGALIVRIEGYIHTTPPRPINMRRDLRTPPPVACDPFLVHVPLFINRLLFTRPAQTIYLFSDAHRAVARVLAHETLAPRTCKYVRLSVRESLFLPPLPHPLLPVSPSSPRQLEPLAVNLYDSVYHRWGTPSRVRSHLSIEPVMV
ncbi:hypothetical protein EVAR_22296_1 [Eumeta japonica]|uniref:Uncharacterized protein n=1 Tax=Eumeta variegata TaxID=151549 RepID=A0A4C1UBE7_EUMVA|nr:hypothetical protein EVAR_22296_1 [Eumeta japonica]